MKNGDEKNYWEREVPPGNRGVRLDKFWADELAGEGVSRGRIKAWIESGLALVDGEVVDRGKHKLSGLEIVVLRAAPPEPGEGDAEPVAGDLDVLFEDDHVAVVDKPAGLTTHPAPGEPGPTLVNLCLHRWPDMAGGVSGMDGQRPGIVHRLDKDTSGLIAVARTEADRLALASDFAARRVRKVYLAVVHGCPARPEGTIDAPIGRHPTRKTAMAVTDKGGREARSDYRVLWTGPRGLASLVAVRIHTGRTHQIRVHMAHIGHPLLGDAVYGPRENAEWSRRDDRLATLAPRQMLHAFFPLLPPPRQQGGCDPVARAARGLPRPAGRAGARVFPGGHRGHAGLRQVRAALLFARGRATLLQRGRVRGNPLCAGRRRRGHDRPAVRQRVHFGERRGGQARTVRGHARVRGGPARGHGAGPPHGAPRLRGIFPRPPRRPGRLCRDSAPAGVGLGQGAGGRGVAGVRCASDKRTGELREKRGLAPETLAVFDSWQWPEPDKLAACDLVLENAGGLGELKGEAARLAAWAGDRFRERNSEFAAWLDGLWPRLADELAEGLADEPADDPAGEPGGDEG